MDQGSYSFGRGARAICFVCLSAALEGCAQTQVRQDITTKSSTELAVEALAKEWLTECQGMPPLPENTVGDLAEDAIVAMTLLAECRARHNALVQHLTPIVEKEKAK